MQTEQSDIMLPLFALYSIYYKIATKQLIAEFKYENIIGYDKLQPIQINNTHDIQDVIRKYINKTLLTDKNAYVGKFSPSSIIKCDSNVTYSD